MLVKGHGNTGECHRTHWERVLFVDDARHLLLELNDLRFVYTFDIEQGFLGDGEYSRAFAMQIHKHTTDPGNSSRLICYSGSVISHFTVAL